jgi:hypothetical protein
MRLEIFREPERRETLGDPKLDGVSSSNTVLAIPSVKMRKTKP